ncbi:MAG: DUF1896 family protein [Prevotella sp.]|nr:DUF1896 family protein [Prevotella sp.]
MSKKSNVSTDLGYYSLYLLRYLKVNRFPQADDAAFINARADRAADTYEQARRDGYPADGAQELAMAVLTDGLGLSRCNVLEEVVANEFSHEVGDAAREAFMEKVLPEVDEVFAIYDLSDGGFSQTKEYDDLYNELTGAVALYIEAYGV